MGDLHVQRNGADLPSGAGSITMTSTSFSFSGSAALSAGDHVDFVMAPGSSLFWHAIALDAKVLRFEVRTSSSTCLADSAIGSMRT